MLKIVNNFNKVAIICAILGAMPSFAEEAADAYVEQWAPPVGTALPVLTAPDHTGTPRNFEDLKGPNGLLLFLNRSADW